MKKQVLNISIKMIITGIVSLMIAYILKLEFYTTAAAAGILSIQLTRKDFISIAIKRSISGVFAIIVSALLFHLFGQTFFMFALFLIGFIILSWFFKLSEGIVLSVVLVTHFLLVDVITIRFVFDELLLLFISIGVAFFVNMFYPNYSKKLMIENLYSVDSIIEDYLNDLINCSINGNEFKSNVYLKRMHDLMVDSQMIDKNFIIYNDHRYITYLYMRRMQLQILDNIYRSMKRIEYEHEYIDKIVAHLNDIKENISFENRAKSCYERHLKLKEYFINSDLPTTRKEFETRAILFQLLNEIEQFLKIKLDFHNKYPNFIVKETNYLKSSDKK